MKLIKLQFEFQLILDETQHFCPFDDISIFSNCCHFMCFILSKISTICGTTGHNVTTTCFNILSHIGGKCGFIGSVIFFYSYKLFIVTQPCWSVGLVVRYNFESDDPSSILLSFSSVKSAKHLREKQNMLNYSLSCRYSLNLNSF